MSSALDWLAKQAELAAIRRAACREGSRIAIRIAMIAITTSNSIRVKALVLPMTSILRHLFMSHPFA